MRSEADIRAPTPLPDSGSDAFTCDVDCSGCLGATTAPGHAGTADADLSGWRLAATSFAVFCVPIALAIVGAVLWSGSAPAQLVGGVLGLGLGAVSMGVITRASDSNDRESR